jgi:hypothetical protein
MKIYINYPIIIEGFAFLDNNVGKAFANILEEMKFPLDRPRKFYPHFIIVTTKRSKNIGSNDHESKPLKEALENNHSWMEVKAILDFDANPTNAMSNSFPPHKTKKLNVSPYYTFYRPKGTMMTKAEMKFITFIEERRKEVFNDSFIEHKMEAWWRIRWYLGVENIPYDQNASR